MRWPEVRASAQPASLSFARYRRNPGARRAVNIESRQISRRNAHGIDAFAHAPPARCRSDFGLLPMPMLIDRLCEDDGGEQCEHSTSW